MFALEPQQGLAHRLAADGIAFGELLLAHSREISRQVTKA
jgi:hypothetical protein